MEPLNILIADDETISRRVLQRAVEAGGHVCVAASSGVEAWQLFRDAQPDVLITDWLMPGMDGLELCRLVRGHESERYTFIVLLTSLDDKAHFVEGMEAGADDYLSKPFDPDELRARLLAARRVVALHARLAEQNRALGELNRSLAESARTDPLTGLGNRLRLWEDLEAAQSQLDRYGFTFALAMCDVDHFKAYNDRYGHPAGDQALRAVGQAIVRTCRSGDRAYRYGGEEFLLVFPAQDATGAMKALDRIRVAVEQLAIEHRENPPLGILTISGGVALPQPTGMANVSQLVDAADAALYEAKQAGRNTVRLYQPRAQPQP